MADSFFCVMADFSKIERLIFSRFPHTPTVGQQEACSALVRFLYDPDPHAAFVLKGYAGTGKTSLVSALIKVAPLLRIRTMLLAPTGRAAKVLSNYSGNKAYTIHKKIYMTVTDGSGVMRVARALNKHSYTLFIVDEASMIGADTPSDAVAGRSLLEDLIDFVNDGYHCRLLFVGDGAQLPPVGASESPALSADYLESMSMLSVSHYELTEVVRQRQESGILYNATRLRQQIVDMDDQSAIEYPLFDLGGFSDVSRLGGYDLSESITVAFGGDGLEQVAIVTRSNKRANLFNQAIRNRVLFREEQISAGDYLMVVKNNYFWVDETSDVGFIANGDIVEVMSVRHFQELYGFHFVDATLRLVDYPNEPTIDCKLLLETLESESPSLTRDEHHRLYLSVMEDYADLPTRADQLKELQKNPYYNALQVKFSYALTCHKTQGGQWRTIYIDAGFLPEEMKNRDYLRWLYTAFTRATEQVYLIDFEDCCFVGRGDDASESD